MTSPRPLSLRRVVRDVGEGDAVERAARARMAALAAVDHPGLVPPLDVRRDGSTVQVCTPRVSAPDLGTARGTGPHAGITSLEQWVWLMSGLADALAALHRHGLAHGDVSPGNVLVAERPLLIDLIGPALGREHGTPGFAAPEAAGGPSPAGDVYALGRLGRHMAAPTIAVQADAWTAPLLAEDPAARPPAESIAAGLTSCAETARWRPEAVDVAPSLRSAASTAATARDPRAWAWRLRRRVPLVAGTVVLALTAGFLWSALPPSVPEGAAGATTVLVEAAAQPPVGVEPTDAARELTRARFAALESGDGDALAGLAVPGSAAWAQLEHQAALLADGAAVEGLGDPEIEASTVMVDGEAATVEVTTRIGAHTWVTAEGERREIEAAVETAVLELVWSGERWRVSDVSAAP
ncbi:hypothetical protein QQX10_01540 [Demequina sp. SYSU T00039]|uniref:Protein kinase domain-containing protein n=1 Tax=Demequina lignilytica TaxID=3051663 RepID=A0AAW7M3D0_9MICO|nr:MULTISPECIES: hypothetical protein [unclassified Demequina]MDN4486842.1 hypothetical protein [Demequina sp. SYSU T00039]MDN4489526.1 hypothetical protein [Demequina sp. SYSU T00068]